MENTRTRKLKQLQGAGLVTTEVLEKKGRPFVHYTLTQMGKEVLKMAVEMEDRVQAESHRSSS